MLIIRLQRIGKKHQPSYRLVVAERRSKLIAPPTEDLGSYNSFSKKANFKTDRVKHWLSVGARPSATTHNLLVREGMISAPKRKIHIAKPAAKEAPAAVAAESAPAEAAA